MAYVKCHSCDEVVHYKPVNVIEFYKRFVEDNEAIYCINCFKKREKEPENTGGSY